MTNRLRQFLEFKGIKVATFEKQICVANQTIRKALTNNTSITTAVLEKILISFPELNANWLLTGKGSMLNDSAKVPETQHEITVSIKIDVSDPLYNELIQRLKK